MTVQARKVYPEPVVQPPATYELTGLNLTQVKLLRDLIGLLNYGEKENMTEVFNALNGVGGPRGPWSRGYEFAGVDSISRPGKLGLINICPIG